MDGVYGLQLLLQMQHVPPIVDQILNGAIFPLATIAHNEKAFGKSYQLGQSECIYSTAQYQTEAVVCWYQLRKQE
jgi:hypothetical protein